MLAAFTSAFAYLFLAKEVLVIFYLFMALWVWKLLRHLCCFPAVGEERVKTLKQELLVNPELLSCAYSLIWEFMAHCNQRLDEILL